MLKELYESIVNLGIRVAKAEGKREPKPVTFLTDEHEHAYLDENGELTFRPKRTGRSHEVERLEDVVVATQKWGDDSVVFVSQLSIRSVFDDRELGINSCRMELKHSTAWKTIQSLVGGKPFSQPELIRLLRNEFDGFGGNLLPVVRNIKFRSESASNIQHGNESLGRSIELAVAGADKVAESFLVTVPVYSNVVAEPFGVKITVEILAEKQQFVLRANPDQVDDGVKTALQKVVDYLSDALDGVEVFIGSYRSPE